MVPTSVLFRTPKPCLYFTGVAWKLAHNTDNVCQIATHENTLIYPFRRRCFVWSKAPARGNVLRPKDDRMKNITSTIIFNQSHQYIHALNYTCEHMWLVHTHARTLYFTWPIRLGVFGSVDLALRWNHWLAPSTRTKLINTRRCDLTVHQNKI